MDFAQFQQRVTEAREYCRQKIEQTKHEFGLGGFARYDLDLTAGTLRFFDEAENERVRATIQVAGSWSPKSETWLWSWANDSVPNSSRDRMDAVREFGIREQIPLLQDVIAPCTEAEAWAMAALAGQLLAAEGFYRVPGSKSQLFLLLASLARVESQRSR